MVLPKGVDHLDARGAVLRRHFIEPVEQRQDLVGVDPGAARLPGYLVLLI
jgi:hypothetical protein